MGIEAIELMLEAAESAGYNVDWGGIFDDIDLDVSDFETLIEECLANIEIINVNFFIIYFYFVNTIQNL